MYKSLHLITARTRHFQGIITKSLAIKMVDKSQHFSANSRILYSPSVYSVYRWALSIYRGSMDDSVEQLNYNGNKRGITASRLSTNANILARVLELQKKAE